MPTSTNLFRVGLPTLTKSEEKLIIDHLLNHPSKEELTFDEALSSACQLLMDIVKANYQHDMSCVQTSWFYGNANALGVSLECACSRSPSSASRRGRGLLALVHGRHSVADEGLGLFSTMSIEESRSEALHIISLLSCTDSLSLINGIRGVVLSQS